MNSIPASKKLLPGWSIWAAAALFAVVSVGTVFNKLTAHDEARESVNAAPIDATVSPLKQLNMGQHQVATITPAPAVESKKSVLLAAVAPVSSADASEVDDASNDTVPAPAPGHVALTLKFSGDSWTEVYDANKRVVAYEMGHDATTRHVSGLAPLSVVLGSAPQVALQINGRNAVIPQNRVSASVARFVVAADGTIH